MDKDQKRPPIKTWNKNDYLFVWHKLKIYGILSVLLLAPVILFLDKLEGELTFEEALFCIWISNAVLLYVCISVDGRATKKELAHLIMRRRHFDEINEKEDP